MDKRIYIHMCMLMFYIKCIIYACFTSLLIMLIQLCGLWFLVSCRLYCYVLTYMYAACSHDPPHKMYINAYEYNDCCCLCRKTKERRTNKQTKTETNIQRYRGTKVQRYKGKRLNIEDTLIN